MRNHFAGLAARGVTLLRRAVAATVGHVSWQPPGWLCVVASMLRAHRAKTALALCVVFAGFGGRYAYLHRRMPVPPHLVHGVMTTPEIPALADRLAPSYLRVRFDESAAALDLGSV